MEQKYIGNETPMVVKNLLIINVLFFIAKMALSSKGINIDEMFALHYPKSQLFRPWQIVTHFFMHGDFFHLFFNMFGLWMFGRILEMVWGAKRFLFFYTITAISAALLHFLVVNYQLNQLISTMDPSKVSEVLQNGFDAIRAGKNYVDVENAKLNYIFNGSVMGASGAIFGILGGCLILFPNTQLFLLFPPIPIKLKYAVTFYGLYELYSGLSNNPGDNVAHFAHLGGLIAGIIIVKYWNRNKRETFY